MLLFQNTETDEERLNDYEKIINEINANTRQYNERHSSILIVKILLVIARAILKK